MAENNYPYNKAPDRRARLRPKPFTKMEDYVYADGIMNVLRNTDGMVWLNTPNIDYSQNVEYNDVGILHSNTEYRSYKRTPTASLTVTGTYVASTPTDAYYMLACMHFLRSATKTDFGINAEVRAAPPPVLLFSAYGSFSFNNIPVVIKSFNINYSDDVDYVKVPLPSRGYAKSIGENFSQYVRVTHDLDKSEVVWIPQVMTVTVTLDQQPTPNFQTNKFSLKEFKNGDMLKKGGII